MNISDSINSKSTVLMSLLVGFYLSINTIMAYLFPSAEGGVATGGLLGISYVGSAFMIVITSVFSGNFRVKNITLYSVLLPIILIFLYNYTKENIGAPRTLFPMFLIFSVVSFCLPFFAKIDVRLVLKTIMVLSLPALFRINQVFFAMVQTRGSISMGYSYSFLMPILVSIIYLFFYYKKETKSEKVLTVFCFGANIVFLLLLVAFGVRGPVLSIILLLLVLYVVRVDPTKRGVKLVKSKGVFILLAVFLIVQYLEPILIFTHSVFSSFGMEVRFIDKCLALIETSNVINGRDILNEITIDAIKKKPWFGYGIDQFDNVFSGFLYPHNFVLQLLFDGGFFLTIIVLLPVLISLFLKLRNCTYNDFVIIISLFFASVPGGLLSGDLWAMSTLWFFFGATISKTMIHHSSISRFDIKRDKKRSNLIK